MDLRLSVRHVDRLKRRVPDLSCLARVLGLHRIQHCVSLGGLSRFEVLKDGSSRVAKTGGLRCFFEEHLASNNELLLILLLIAPQIALLCVHTTTSVRPTMRECAEMLLQQREVPRLPRRPMTLYTISSLASSTTESGTASMPLS